MIKASYQVYYGKKASFNKGVGDGVTSKVHFWLYFKKFVYSYDIKQVGKGLQGWKQALPCHYKGSNHIVYYQEAKGLYIWRYICVIL